MGAYNSGYSEPQGAPGGPCARTVMDKDPVRILLHNCVYPLLVVAGGTALDAWRKARAVSRGSAEGG